MPGASKLKKLLVIVPTYNETENIGAFITAVKAVSKKTPHWEFDILVVDDNSPDGTANIVKQMQKADKSLQLLSGKRQGLGRAYLRGFAHGLQSGSYTAVVMIDADFSHDPSAIPQLLKALDTGADYVSGSRYLKGGSTSNWPMRRSINSWGANLFAKLFVGSGGVQDMTSGFKAIRVSALKQIQLEHIQATGYVFLVNLLHEFSRNGFVVQEVPITFTNRQNGKSKLRLRDVTEFVYLVYRLNPDSTARRAVRFGFVGLSGAIVNLGVITLLVRWWHVAPIPADAIAIQVSIVSNFFLNHYYTFRVSSNAVPRKDDIAAILGKLLKFNVVMLGGAAISFSIFTITYKIFGVPYILADMLGIGIAMSWNYWMSTRIVWKVVDG